MLVAALGSSFASGPALTPIVDQRAARSSRNYAHRLAAQIPADLVDLTSAGATTADLLNHSQQFADGSRVAPQIDAVPEETDVITLTVGGNDLHYVGALTYAVLRRHAPHLHRTSEAAEQFPDGLSSPPVAEPSTVSRPDSPTSSRRCVDGLQTRRSFSSTI